MAVPVDNTLAFLLGDWSIERLISDHRDRSQATFSGVAVVEPVAAGASYLERGQISRGGHVGPARRALRFAAREDGTVRVDFQDGRPFLDLGLTGGRCVATHRCGADVYGMTFEVLDQNRIRETWRVTGPAKDYEAATAWQRL